MIEKIKPILRRRKIVCFSSFIEHISLPSTNIFLRLEYQDLLKRFNNVLLPEPDSPTTVTNSPLKL